MSQKARQKINDKARKVIDAFKKDTHGYGDKVINQVIKAYDEDKKFFKSCNSKLKFKPENNSTDQFSKGCYELGQLLIKGYGSLNSDDKKQYRREYYKNNKTPRCPICGQVFETSGSNKDLDDPVIADLDHFLPKSVFPQFALNPDNLIPICKECNNIKSDNFPLDYSQINQLAALLEKFGIAKYSHPFNLSENLTIDFHKILFAPKDTNIFENINFDSNEYKLLEYLGLHKRFKVIANRCFSQLLQYVRYAEIKTPDNLENFLLLLASANYQEKNTTLHLHDHPKIWADFLDWLNSSQDNILALWEEVKDYSTTISSFQVFY